MSRVTSLLAVSVAAILATAAPAVADAPYPVPDNGTITVEGDGSGHGKGLSQYGAYGAARAPHNLDADQILDFYYPGTEQAHRMEPRAERWRITPTAEGAKVSYHRGRWRTFQNFRGDVGFEAGGAPITLRTPDSRVAYRGALRSTTYDGDRITVNVLPMEKYVRGVLPAELSSIWPQQAMRAQAVASRTYAAYERGHAGMRPYDLCDTAACQAYGGASAETTRTDEAVAATARRVLTYGGETAFAQYSASNGGWTVDGGRPYLPAQEDPYEQNMSPDYYGWTVEVTISDVEDVYNIDNLTSIAIETRDGDGPRGGRVETVRLENADTEWSGTVTGDSFRRNFGLFSTLFEITAVD